MPARRRLLLCKLDTHLVQHVQQLLRKVSADLYTCRPVPNVSRTIPLAYCGTFQCIYVFLVCIHHVCNATLCMWVGIQSPFQASFISLGKQPSVAVTSQSVAKITSSAVRHQHYFYAQQEACNNHTPARTSTIHETAAPNGQVRTSLLAHMSHLPG